MSARLTPKQIRAVCAELGIEYRSRNSRRCETFLGVPRMPSWRASVCLDDREATTPYLVELVLHAREAADLGVHHLWSSDEMWIEHPYRITLCGKKWAWHVAAAWTSNYAKDSRDGGCQHCRVLLDAAMERGEVELSVLVNWKKGRPV
jgi:hypothetical protein